MNALDFTAGNGSGNYVKFNLPSLAYWDMVSLQLEDTADALVL